VQGLLRRLLQWMVPHARRLRLLARVGKFVTFAMPRALAAQVPDNVTTGLASDTPGSKQVLVLQGCAQQVTTGQVNQGFATVARRTGYWCVDGAKGRLLRFSGFASR
jgi:hypothetical protein